MAAVTNAEAGAGAARPGRARRGRGRGQGLRLRQHVTPDTDSEAGHRRAGGGSVMALSDAIQVTPGQT